MSNSLQSHGLQHARLPCPSLPLGVCSNSCPLSQWCHSNISSSVTHFSCPQSGQHQGLFQWVGSSCRIGASASASVLSMNIQDWFPLGLTGFISLQCKGLLRIFSNTTVSSKASILQYSAFFMVQFSHPCVTTGKTIALSRWTFVGKVISLLFNML